jgi:hypothetical protein
MALLGLYPGGHITYFSNSAILDEADSTQVGQVSGQLTPPGNNYQKGTPCTHLIFESRTVAAESPREAWPLPWAKVPPMARIQLEVLGASRQ